MRPSKTRHSARRAFASTLKRSAESSSNTASASSKSACASSKRPARASARARFDSAAADPERPARRARDAQHLLEERHRLVDASLVGQDLRLVVHLDDRADDVPRTLLHVAALAVVRDRLVPAPLVVRVDAEVREHDAEPAQVAELLVDRPRELEVAEAVRRAEVAVRRVEQVVRVRERAAVARTVGMLGGSLEPANRLLVVRLPVVDRARVQLDRRPRRRRCSWPVVRLLEPREALRRRPRAPRRTGRSSSCSRALLAEEPRVERARDSAPTSSRARLERVERAVVRAEALADVAERLVARARRSPSVELGKVRRRRRSRARTARRRRRWRTSPARARPRRPRTSTPCRRRRPRRSAARATRRPRRRAARARPRRGSGCRGAAGTKAPRTRWRGRGRAGTRTSCRPRSATNSRSHSQRAGSPASGISSSRISAMKSSSNVGPTTAA